MLLKANKTLIYEDIVVRTGEIFDIDPKDERFYFFNVNSSVVENKAQNGSEKPKKSNRKK